MRITQSLSALNVQNKLVQGNPGKSKSLDKLGGGPRIIKAENDAAGLAISEKVRAQINGVQESVRNSQESISMAQAAEGALDKANLILQRMREITLQASNGNNTGTDKKAIQEELDKLTSEINNIGDNTLHGTKIILDDTQTNNSELNTSAATKALNNAFKDVRAKFGQGYNKSDAMDLRNFNGDYIGISNENSSIKSDDYRNFYLKRPLDISNARDALNTIEDAIKSLSKDKAKLGAYTNVLENSVINLENVSDKQVFGESKIKDASMAKETMTFIKKNFLEQASKAMQVQANRSSQEVLPLLR